MRVLDLGCGNSEAARSLWPDAELVRVDLDEAVKPDVVADVRSLPGDLGAFDHILASHVLEHIARVEVLKVLIHWSRFLAPDGTLHVVVPDLMWAVEQLANDHYAPEVFESIFGSQQGETQFHKWGFVALTLHDILDRAGYVVDYLRAGPYLIRWPGRDPVTARQLYARAHVKGKA